MRLRTPAGGATRPTSERVREAVFSAVAAWNGTAERAVSEQLSGQGFLDLCAGSGAVGLEAASRGAARVVCVEKDRRTAALIADNARSTGLARVVRSVGGPVDRYLEGFADERFDIIWFDPPYAFDDEELDRLVATAAERALAYDGLLAVERSSRGRAPQFPAGMVSWQNRYGETVVHLAQARREDS